MIRIKEIYVCDLCKTESGQSKPSGWIHLTTGSVAVRWDFCSPACMQTVLGRACGEPLQWRICQMEATICLLIAEAPGGAIEAGALLDILSNKEPTALAGCVKNLLLNGTLRETQRDNGWVLSLTKGVMPLPFYRKV